MREAAGRMRCSSAARWARDDRTGSRKLRCARLTSTRPKTCGSAPSCPTMLGLQTCGYHCSGPAPPRTRTLFLALVLPCSSAAAVARCTRTSLQHIPALPVRPSSDHTRMQGHTGFHSHMEDIQQDVVYNDGRRLLRRGSQGTAFPGTVWDAKNRKARKSSYGR